MSSHFCKGVHRDDPLNRQSMKNLKLHCSFRRLQRVPPSWVGQRITIEDSVYVLTYKIIINTYLHTYKRATEDTHNYANTTSKLVTKTRRFFEACHKNGITLNLNLPKWHLMYLIFFVWYSFGWIWLSLSPFFFATLANPHFWLLHFTLVKMKQIFYSHNKTSSFYY